MESIASVLVIFGLMICVAGGIWFLIAAFSESILWGIGCLLFSPVSLVFLVLHWNRAYKPFLVQLAGLAPIVAGVLMSPPPVV
ncbi:MAG: hypothetical protein KDA87_06935 [Planctomycetales bacterium]|nr:hypothetical protein [Planctomycetales bacterium]